MEEFWRLVDIDIDVYGPYGASGALGDVVRRVRRVLSSALCIRSLRGNLRFTVHPDNPTRVRYELRSLRDDLTDCPCSILYVDMYWIHRHLIYNVISPTFDIVAYYRAVLWNLGRRAEKLRLDMIRGAYVDMALPMLKECVVMCHFDNSDTTTLLFLHQFISNVGRNSPMCFKFRIETRLQGHTLPNVVDNFVHNYLAAPWRVDLVEVQDADTLYINLKRGLQLQLPEP